MLRTGTSLESAIETVRAQEDACRGIFSHSGPSQGAMWRAYLDWVDASTKMLRNHFTNPEILAGALTARHWLIVGDPSHPRQNFLISEEVEDQTRRLQALKDQLEGYRSLRDRPGAPTIADTNVFLHFAPIDTVDWPAIVGEPQVRLIVALVILDELDRKRHEGTSDYVRNAARSAVVPLDRVQGQLEQKNVAPLRDGTTVEYLPDERGHRRQSDADTEILDRAEFLAQILGVRVNVVTDDRSMRCRCMARREAVRPVAMLDKYRRRPK